jgi:hypothetical protein
MTAESTPSTAHTGTCDCVGEEHMLLLLLLLDDVPCEDSCTGGCIGGSLPCWLTGPRS